MKVITVLLFFPNNYGNPLSQKIQDCLSNSMFI